MSQELAILRGFLLYLLPDGIEVIKGQDNRAAEPQGTDYVVITQIGRERLGLNTTTYTDNYPASTGVRSDVQPTQTTIQIDVHGANSAQNLQIITTLFQSDYGLDYFRGINADTAPLYMSSPRQAPFLNGEQQVEERWSVDAVIEFNPSITTQQDFAAQLSVGLIEADTAYH